MKNAVIKVIKRFYNSYWFIVFCLVFNIFILSIYRHNLNLWILGILTAWVFSNTRK